MSACVVVSCCWWLVARQRQKNRRSILSQGDERWKDVVQELEKELGYACQFLPFVFVV